MNQVTTIDISSDIIPTKGIGEVMFGMNCFYLRDFVNSNFTNRFGVQSSQFDKKDWDTDLDSPFFQHLHLTYKNCLTISINLFKGEIGQFTVNEGYSGKIFGIAGIGDRTKKLFKKYEANFDEFEDDVFHFCFEDRYWLGVHIGDGCEYEDFPDEALFKKYLRKPIQKITLFDDEQRIGIGADLPVDWQHSK